MAVHWFVVHRIRGCKVQYTVSRTWSRLHTAVQ